MHQSIATAVEQPYPINTSMPPLTLQNNYQPQQVLPEPPTDPSTQDEESSREAPMYVNHKQYHRIIKRREARAKFEAARTKGKGDKKDKGYIHESRHKHAMTRPRGPGGRFLPATPTPSYAQLITTQCNLITPENALKFDAVEPVQGVFDFSVADQIVAFARNNGMLVRGHTLVWHQQLPSWLTNGQWTNETLTNVLKTHISNVVSHYKGKIYAWDVVNEVIDDNGNYRDSIWYRVIGPAYIRIAFQAAKDADPNVKLYLNDYNLDYFSDKLTTTVELIKNLQVSNTPIDGVGSQAHLIVGNVSPWSLSNTMKSITNLNLEFAYTELDIREKTPISSTTLDLQATNYADVAKSCVGNEKCVGVQTWGITDKYSWIPLVFPGYGEALVFDVNYNPKPAFKSLLLALQGSTVNSTVVLPVIAPAVSSTALTTTLTSTSVSSTTPISQIIYASTTKSVSNQLTASPTATSNETDTSNARRQLTFSFGYVFGSCILICSLYYIDFGKVI
ncbi:hypothetical protein HK098_000144 [Nowakowskiella sp. JEL0407]|nr:hypothetical protein HK098_000144 [Nowakowskiella sp. JEL0407]